MQLTPNRGLHVVWVNHDKIGWSHMQLTPNRGLHNNIAWLDSLLFREIVHMKWVAIPIKTEEVFNIVVQKVKVKIQGQMSKVNVVSSKSGPF